MKTETENLRELDVEVAKRVFGLVYSNFQWFAGEHGPSVYHKLPKYSTDPAAAMMVLEKCCKEKKQAVKIWFSSVHNQWAAADDGCFKTQYAETLPIAICKFANVLFSK